MEAHCPIQTFGNCRRRVGGALHGPGVLTRLRRFRPPDLPRPTWRFQHVRTLTELAYDLPRHSYATCGHAIFWYIYLPLQSAFDMASGSSNNESDGNTSYSKMAVGDVEAIGAHCQMAFCHQLDFLPFRCESCKGTFCLDHRTETAHKCVKAGTWARAKSGVDSGSSSRGSTPKPSLLNHEQQCAEVQCKSLINTSLTPGVHCQNCNRLYCLKHRMREDHDCKNLKPLGARPQALQSQREKGMAALEKLRAWGASKKAAAATSKPLGSGGLLSKVASKTTSNAKANLAEINKLKSTAKGDEKVPQDSRVYLHVEASADTTTAKYPTGKFFYSKDWSIGRVLDVAAKALQVQNVNNRGGGEEDRLRIFHVESGRLLEFSEKLGQCCQTGNTIVLLRGVGPAVPDLIQA